MTDYEMKKQAKMQAAYLVEALKNDDELLDMVFPPKLLNLQEASELSRIPESTIKHKISEIPHFKAGKRLVFTDRGILRWMKRNVVSHAAAMEIELEASVRKVQ